MEYLNIIGIIVSVVVLAIALVLGPIFWFKTAKNMLKIWVHVKPEALENNPELRINRFNAMFYPDALDAEGLEARSAVFNNGFKFIILILIVVVCAKLFGTAT